MSVRSSQHDTARRDTVRTTDNHRNSAAEANRSVAVCIGLLYTLAVADFALKFLPYNIGVVLRYLPELALYAYTLRAFLITKGRAAFPLLLPLTLFVIAVSVSALVTFSPAVAVVSDVRSYWRFACFAYILSRVDLEAEHTERIVDALIRLAIVELVIAIAQLVGGSAVRTFFAPALQWSSGKAVIVDVPKGGVGWLSGTFGNYNVFGFFMGISCVLALSRYFVRRSASALLLTVIVGGAVILSYSRHSIMALGISIVLLLCLRKQVALSIAVLLSTVVAIVTFVSAAPGNVLGAESVSVPQRIGSAFTTGALSGDPKENVRLYLFLTVAPRFLSSSPLLGEGSGAASSLASLSDRYALQTSGFRAIQDLPSWAQVYLTDVVWVWFLGQYGLCGLAAFAFVLGKIAMVAYEVRRRATASSDRMLAEVCLVSLWVYVLTGFFSLTIVARDASPTFWVLVGCLFAVANRQRRRRRQSCRQPLRERQSQRPLRECQRQYVQ